MQQSSYDDTLNSAINTNLKWLIKVVLLFMRNSDLFYEWLLSIIFGRA